jgi:aldehyde dehydrogenase (NAD+)
MESPVIVADDANIDIAARRIVWGKCINAGQSCIAPDYVLCTENVRERLIEACKTNLRDFYGEVQCT